MPRTLSRRLIPSTPVLLLFSPPVLFACMLLGAGATFERLDALGYINREDLYPLDGVQVGTPYQYLTNFMAWELLLCALLALVMLSACAVAFVALRHFLRAFDQPSDGSI